MYDGATKVRDILDSLLEQRQRCTDCMIETNLIVTRIGGQSGEQSPYILKWWMAKKAWDFYKEYYDCITFSEEFLL